MLFCIRGIQRKAKYLLASENIWTRVDKHYSRTLFFSNNTSPMFLWLHPYWTLVSNQTWSLMPYIQKTSMMPSALYLTGTLPLNWSLVRRPGLARTQSSYKRTLWHTLLYTTLPLLVRTIPKDNAQGPDGKRHAHLSLNWPIDQMFISFLMDCLPATLAK